MLLSLKDIGMAATAIPGKTVTKRAYTEAMQGVAERIMYRGRNQEERMKRNKSLAVRNLEREDRGTDRRGLAEGKAGHPNTFSS